MSDSNDFEAGKKAAYSNILKWGGISIASTAALAGYSWFMIALGKHQATNDYLEPIETSLREEFEEKEAGLNEKIAKARVEERQRTNKPGFIQRDVAILTPADTTTGELQQDAQVIKGPVKFLATGTANDNLNYLTAIKAKTGTPAIDSAEIVHSSYDQVNGRTFEIHESLLDKFAILEHIAISEMVGITTSEKYNDTALNSIHYIFEDASTGNTTKYRIQEVVNGGSTTTLAEYEL